MRNCSSAVISLVILSRKRLRALTNCIYSFFTKANVCDRVEAIVLADFNDYTARNFEEYVLNNKFNVKVIFCNGKTEKYGVQCATGRYVWVLHDYCEMMTPGWDDMVISNCDYLLSKPDGVLYVLVDIGDCNYCELTSTKTIEVFDNVNVWPIIKCLPENRTVDLRTNIKVLQHLEYCVN